MSKRIFEKEQLYRCAAECMCVCARVESLVAAQENQHNCDVQHNLRFSAIESMAAVNLPCV